MNYMYHICIVFNFRWSHINAWSCLVTGVAVYVSEINIGSWINSRCGGVAHVICTSTNNSAILWKEKCKLWNTYRLRNVPVYWYRYIPQFYKKKRNDFSTRWFCMLEIPFMHAGGLHVGTFAITQEPKVSLYQGWRVHARLHQDILDA